MGTISEVKPPGPHDPEVDPTAGSQQQRPSLSAGRTLEQQRNREFSPIDPDTDDRISKNIERFMNSQKIQLEFQVHKGTERVTVKVINKESGRVIRVIPSEEQMLNLAESTGCMNLGVVETKV